MAEVKSSIIKKHLCLLLILAMLLAVFAGFVKAEIHELQPGDQIHGFTVTEVYDSNLLHSTIYVFDHVYSGANLVYVKNDDTEAAFSIGYRTPYVDETDTNHVFEHAVLSGSEKYPSSDIFFDMDNKAYLTFSNAYTNLISTQYLLFSQSQEQLLKAIDVYLSCMEAPMVLNDERIFQREAVRYELYDPNDDITINGTVFSEDCGFLTNIESCTLNAVIDALYPGETASNFIGQASWNYRDLTYEHTIETFERCYHFDNSQIFLYGDLDLDRILVFLDEEYLSRYPAEGTDLSSFADGPSAPGFEDVQVSIPAYEGDVVEHNSAIVYAIDLSDKTDVELCQYNLLAGLLSGTGSVLYNTFLEQGIENPVEAYVVKECAKPFIQFSMSYADPEQKDVFKTTIETVLAMVAEDGIDPSLLEAYIKGKKRNAILLRNNSHVGSALSTNILLQWARSGDSNYYRVLEEALDSFCTETAQDTIRNLAGSLLTSVHGALVTAVPTPGLAEQHDRELADYLSEMKASMTQEELQTMVDQTAAFDEWNMTEISNNDFTIPPEDLPDPQTFEWSVRDMDGILVYNGETSLEDVGEYAIYFDLSGMSREELMYLSLSNRYHNYMDTSSHTAEQISLLMMEYISEFFVDFVYPGEAAGSFHRPMLVLSFTSLTDDFEEGLELLLEIFTQTDFSDEEMLRYLTAVNVDSLDISRNRDGLVVADDATTANAGLEADSMKFQMDISWQDRYYLIAEALQRLDNEEGYAKELAAEYENAVKKAFTSDNLIFMTVSSKDAADAIIDSAVRILGSLPKKEGADADYKLPEVPGSLGIGIEESLTNTFLKGDYMADPDFIGEYLPFVFALCNHYVIPTLRFQLGAYTADFSFAKYQGFLYASTYFDPNVEKTIQVLKAMPEALKDMEITQEELDGYICKAYAKATLNDGMLTDVMDDMRYDLLGIDYERVYEMVKAIKNASLTDQEAAAEHIAAVLESASLATAGNEALIRADADCFDEVISLRH